MLFCLHGYKGKSCAMAQAAHRAQRRGRMDAHTCGCRKRRAGVTLLLRHLLTFATVLS